MYILTAICVNFVVSETCQMRTGETKGVSGRVCYLKHISIFLSPDFLEDLFSHGRVVLWGVEGAVHKHLPGVACRESKGGGEKKGVRHSTKVTKKHQLKELFSTYRVIYLIMFRKCSSTSHKWLYFCTSGSMLKNYVFSESWSLPLLLLLLLPPPPPHKYSHKLV